MRPRQNRCSRCGDAGHVKTTCPLRHQELGLPTAPPPQGPRRFERWAREVGPRVEYVDLPAEHARRSTLTSGMRLVAIAWANGFQEARRLLDRAERRRENQGELCVRPRGADNTEEPK